MGVVKESNCDALLAFIKTWQVCAQNAQTSGVQNMSTGLEDLVAMEKD